jgi:spoIIIJ-associated protein
MEESLKEKIIAAIKTIMKYVDSESEVAAEEIGSDFFLFNIRTKESPLLIGRDGGNIGSLDHLVKMMLKRESLGGGGFVIDINSYRHAKIERLRQIAKKAALRVSWRNIPETLIPMNSFERRIIHMELSDSPLVEKKSAGIDPGRAVVVSPLKKEDGKKNFNIDEIINS